MDRYDPATALIVVDVQRDFASPDGALAVPGGPGVVEAASHEVARAAHAGATVVYTRDWHPPSTPHFAKDGGVWPVHCVRETDGAAYHPDLTVLEGAFEVLKGTGSEDGYSGFSEHDVASGESSSTALHGHLQRSGISSVVIVGLATDYCVRATALDALRLGYRTTVLADAVAAVDLEPGDGDRALAEIVAAGGLLD